MTAQTLRRITIATLIAALGASLAMAQAKKAAPPAAPAGPPDPSGMYTFLQEGEFVQISIEAAERQFVKVGGNPQEATGRPRMVPASDGKQNSVAEAYDPPKLEPVDGKFPKPRRVTGFVSRFGDLESDKGAFLDHFFTKGQLYGTELTFTTKPVHGVAYEFKGKLERGPAATRAEEGYYVLRGTLKRIATTADKKTTSQTREVVLKSFPDLDGDSGR